MLLTLSKSNEIIWELQVLLFNILGSLNSKSLNYKHLLLHFFLFRPNVFTIDPEISVDKNIFRLSTEFISSKRQA